MGEAPVLGTGQCQFESDGEYGGSKRYHSPFGCGLPYESLNTPLVQWEGRCLTSSRREFDSLGGYDRGEVYCQSLIPA